jgi:hypothetical protein
MSMLSDMDVCTVQQGSLLACCDCLQQCRWGRQRAFLVREVQFFDQTRLCGRMWQLHCMYVRKCVQLYDLYCNVVVTCITAGCCGAAESDALVFQYTIFSGCIVHWSLSCLCTVPNVPHCVHLHQFYQRHLRVPPGGGGGLLLACHPVVARPAAGPPGGAAPLVVASHPVLAILASNIDSAV